MKHEEHLKNITYSVKFIIEDLNTDVVDTLYGDTIIDEPDNFVLAGKHWSDFDIIIANLKYKRLLKDIASQVFKTKDSVALADIFKSEFDIDIKPSEISKIKNFKRIVFSKKIMLDEKGKPYFKKSIRFRSPF